MEIIYGDDKAKKSIFSIYELSDKIGVSVTTLKNWERFFNIYVSRDEKNYRRYSESDVSTFRRIRDLASRGYFLKDIKVLWGSEFCKVDDDNSGIIVEEAVKNKPKDQNFNLVLKPLLNQITEYKEEVKSLHQLNFNLTRQLGRLESDVKNKDEIIKMLTARKWWQIWK